jgi:inorganic pyrophosphatase
MRDYTEFPWARKPHRINVVLEISKDWSTNMSMTNSFTVFRLDRMLFFPVHYQMTS